MTQKVETPIEISDARKSRNRRAEIIGALYRCMATRGYAASTLSDIAEEAGMSSSHLLYYFSGKEAIMEAFFKGLCDRVEAELAELPKDNPGAKIEAIAEMFLCAKRNRKVEQAVTLDLYGQAVQNKAMRRVKIAHDKRIKGVLMELFEQTPRTQGTTSEDAANSAYAMLMGLRATSYYDPQLTPEYVQRLFRLTLYRLAAIKPSRTRKSRSA